ncbi:patatin, partial [Burkholderia vietnamiensis]|nr:patatin [Burkholderia vietnamiensis]
MTENPGRPPHDYAPSARAALVKHGNLSVLPAPGRLPTPDHARYSNMTAPASLRWLAARRLGATLVALWCCAAAAQPVPAADTATRAAQAGAGA